MITLLYITWGKEIFPDEDTCKLYEVLVQPIIKQYFNKNRETMQHLNWETLNLQSTLVRENVHALLSLFVNLYKMMYFQTSSCDWHSAILDFLLFKSNLNIFPYP